MAFKLNFGGVFSNLNFGIRYILLKLFGLALALLFLGLSVLFLGYSLISGASSSRGVEAKVVSISSGSLGHCRATNSWGGLFKLGVEREKGKTEKVISLYPAWPEILNPSLGDVVNVWPPKQPRVGAPFVDGWGWFLLGTFLIVGLVFLEFAFLSLTLR